MRPKELYFVNVLVNDTSGNFKCVKVIHEGSVLIGWVEMLILANQGSLICMKLSQHTHDFLHHHLKFNDEGSQNL